VDQGIHLNTKRFLSSKIFVEKLMFDFLRAVDSKRKRTEGDYDLIVSCVLANLVIAGDRSVIVRMGKHVRYDGVSQRKLIRAIHAMEELGWITLEKGVWHGDASTIARSGLDLVGLKVKKEPKEVLIVRKRGKPVNPDLYFSQEEIGRIKGEIRELNGFLEIADITEYET
jgi:hypothetical protein